MLLEFGAAPFGPQGLDQSESSPDSWFEAASWIPTATSAS